MNKMAIICQMYSALKEQSDKEIREMKLRHMSETVYVKGINELKQTKGIKMGEITIFKAEVTEKWLQEIKEKSKLFLKEIKTKPEFRIIYAHFQDLRKLRIEINKTSVELVKAEKLVFEADKNIIQLEERRILNIILPIENKLKILREEWEESERLIAKKKAAEIAEKQESEYNRQEIIRVCEQAYLENAEFDQKIIDDLAREVEDERLRVEAGKLKQKEEELNAREKELELQEKEKIEDAEKQTKEIIGAMAEPTAKAALELARLGVKLDDPEEEDGIMPMVDLIGQRRKEEEREPIIKAVNNEGEPTVFRIFKDEAEEEEFFKQRVEPEITCPSCDFKFNVEEEK